MLGKRLYKTGMLNIFRLIVLAIVIFFTNDFILDTYTYEKFQAGSRFKLLSALEYHYKYPYEFIMFFLLVLAPAFYYSLVRGARFFEKGFSINFGFPFMNKEVHYPDVKNYKLLHPKNVLTIHTKDNELYLVVDNNIERVVAILDQHNIQGDLSQSDFAKLINTGRKFFIVGVSFTLAIFVLKKLGLFFFR